jgi:hypothetical protein
VAALDGDPGRRHVRELDGVVLARPDGLGQVLADLLGVHIERCDELHITDMVVAELDVHQTRHSCGRVRVLVELDALDERSGAVAHADDGYAHRTHPIAPSLLNAADVIFDQS